MVGLLSLMKKLMKDIVKNKRTWKPSFLNRTVEQETKRQQITKDLVMKGMAVYEAYQISIRRMKI